jgi:hypothetical protein
MKGVVFNSFFNYEIPSPLFEIALVLVRLDHLVSITANANDRIT